MQVKLFGVSAWKILAVILIVLCRNSYGAVVLGCKNEIKTVVLPQEVHNLWSRQTSKKIVAKPCDKNETYT